MGKRKSSSSRAKLQPKKRISSKLDTVFGCPFCGHSSSVECTTDTKMMIGVAACYCCEERFYTKITPLTEPIDIFTEWIDECERLNQDQRAS